MESITRWDIMGTWSLPDLYGKKRLRPANDADIGLKYLRYLTDSNGSGYYYNYDMDKGIRRDAAGRADKDYLADQGVPIHYMQLDSWWYPKTFNKF